MATDYRPSRIKESRLNSHNEPPCAKGDEFLEQYCENQRLHLNELIEEKLEEFERKMDVAIAKGFPNDDPVSHRQGHEEETKKAAERRVFWIGIRNTVAGGLSTMILGGLAPRLFDLFKDLLK